MKDLFKLILGVLTLLFKSRAKSEAEILILRQRSMCFAGGHRNDGTSTRPIVFCLFGLVPLRPWRDCDCQAGDHLRWDRAGFRAYWRWRSRNPVGRLKVSPELRTLIGEMSQANPHCRIDPASSGSSCHPAESGRPSSDNSSSCRPGKVIPLYGGFSDGRLESCVYRKPHPATISVFSKQNPCSCAKIPCSSEIIPCSVG
jgi:hypothetical protein